MRSGCHEQRTLESGVGGGRQNVVESLNAGALINVREERDGCGRTDRPLRDRELKNPARFEGGAVGRNVGGGARRDRLAHRGDRRHRPGRPERPHHEGAVLAAVPHVGGFHDDEPVLVESVQPPVLADIVIGVGQRGKLENTIDDDDVGLIPQHKIGDTRRPGRSYQGVEVHVLGVAQHLKLRRILIRGVRHRGDGSDSDPEHIGGQIQQVAQRWRRGGKRHVPSSKSGSRMIFGATCQPSGIGVGLSPSRSAASRRVSGGSPGSVLLCSGRSSSAASSGDRTSTQVWASTYIAPGIGRFLMYFLPLGLNPHNANVQGDRQFRRPHHRQIMDIAPSGSTG